MTEKRGFGAISTGEKLAYGVGDMALNIAYGSIGFYMLWFMVNAGGLSPARAGLIFMIARFWDAVTDYLMGLISDKTRSRWGRRRPYILFGAIPLGFSFAALWQIPPGSDALRFAYYLGAFILFNSAYTVVAVPYSSLMAEMTQDYDERTSLSGFRMGSSFLGTLVGAAGVTLVVDILFGSLPRSRSWPLMGAAFGAAIVLILAITGFGTRERVSGGKPVFAGFVKTLADFFRLREFRIVLGMFLFNMIGFDVIMATFFFFLTDVVEVSGDPTLYMALPLVVAVFASPLWIQASKRLGKKTAYIVSALYFAAVMLFCLWIPPGNEAAVLAICVLSGIGISASQIIPWSILPDVIEIDEFHNGVRREGAFFGISTFLYKLASAAAIGATGIVLQVFGYVEASSDESVAAAGRVVQSASAVSAVRLLIGLLPGVCFLASALFVHRFPLTRDRFKSMLEELDRRRIAAVQGTEGE